MPPIAEAAAFETGVMYRFYDPSKPMSEKDARRWEIARRFYDSYVRGENRQDSIKAIAELISYCNDVEDIFHGLALYPVGSEIEE